jgi:hypothetical protein
MKRGTTLSAIGLLLLLVASIAEGRNQGPARDEDNILQAKLI